MGYNVWANDQPTLLRSAERAYALPNVPPSFRVLDDTASTVTYGSGWRVGSNAGDYRGADHYTETAGATATFTFTGTGFRYWFSTAAHHGIAGVTVDGGTEQRIDQYSRHPVRRPHLLDQPPTGIRAAHRPDPGDRRSQPGRSGAGDHHRPDRTRSQLRLGALVS